MSQYKGSGTSDDPFIVEFDQSHDAQNAMQFSKPFRFAILFAVAFAMMAGTFSVSSYTSGYESMTREFNVSLEDLVLGQFTFLMGLAFGSLIWPSLGDLVSRKWTLVGFVF
jgi:MFS family permease